MLSKTRKVNGRGIELAHSFSRVSRAVLVMLFFVSMGFYVQHRLLDPSDDSVVRVATPELECLELGDDVCMELELVNTPESRQLGLSGRASLPLESGMLFDFETDRETCMWMKDMNFALDMLWIDSQGQVVDIKRDISPDTFPQLFCGAQPARFVLEVNAGVVDSAGARVGQQLLIDTLVLR